MQEQSTHLETKNTYSALRYVANECLLSFSIEIATFTQFLSISRVSEVHCHNMPYGGSGKNSDTYNQNALEEATRSGPYFDKSASKNVTALLGKTTYLNCRVKNLGNKTVSEINTCFPLPPPPPLPKKRIRIIRLVSFALIHIQKELRYNFPLDYL